MVSVQRGLHSLETGARCSLFRLKGRNLAPDDAAHVLTDVAQDILRNLDEGSRSTRAMADMRPIGFGSDRSIR